MSQIKSIILAAGQGTRLKPYTDDCPKSLVEIGGKTLLKHQTDVLKICGIEDITVISGYREEQIKALGFKIISNSNFETTNMVFSMMCASSLFDGSSDLLISYGDIVFEPKIIEAILACQAPMSTVVDEAWLRLWKLRVEDPLSDAETLKMDIDQNITELGKKPPRTNQKSYNQTFEVIPLFVNQFQE